MSANRRDEALDELAAAVSGIAISGGPRIQQASVEPYMDADGEPALKALIILDAPGPDGWSADFTHELRRQVNRLAAERQLEHVYVTLFTREEYDARDQPEEPGEAVNGTN